MFDHQRWHNQVKKQQQQQQRRRQQQQHQKKASSHPGVNIIKLFFSVTDAAQNKLECFPINLFHVGLMLARKAKSLPLEWDTLHASDQPEKNCHGQILGLLLTKIQ
jgi:hypothetical protein